MRKLYFAILCLMENIKATIHCHRYGVTCNELNTRTELVNLREALHLLSMGFGPVQVDYTSNGAHDTFDFRRTVALLLALTDYRQAIREAVCGVDYDDYTAVCDVPGSTISPIDETALDNVIAPRGNVREAFAYMTWPVHMRRKYVEADAKTRKQLVNSAYCRG